jgi:lysozyme
MDIKDLLKSLREHEGYVPTVYKDSLGIETIGYGFAIKDLNLSETVCNVIIMEKILGLIIEIPARFPWFMNLPSEAQNIVMEMCYQLGVAGFAKFRKTIDYLSHGEYENAAVEMLDSGWAKQTPKRAKTLSNRLKLVK